MSEKACARLKAFLDRVRAKKKAAQENAGDAATGAADASPTQPRRPAAPATAAAGGGAPRRVTVDDRETVHEYDVRRPVANTSTRRPGDRPSASANVSGVSKGGGRNKGKGKGKSKQKGK